MQADSLSFSLFFCNLISKLIVVGIFSSILTLLAVERGLVVVRAPPAIDKIVVLDVGGGGASQSDPEHFSSL